VFPWQTLSKKAPRGLGEGASSAGQLGAPGLGGKEGAPGKVNAIGAGLFRRSVSQHGPPSRWRPPARPSLPSHIPDAPTASATLLAPPRAVVPVHCGKRGRRSIVAQCPAMAQSCSPSSAISPPARTMAPATTTVGATRTGGDLASSEGALLPPRLPQRLRFPRRRVSVRQRKLRPHGRLRWRPLRRLRWRKEVGLTCQVSRPRELDTSSSGSWR
jgi:hypothetical protein